MQTVSFPRSKSDACTCLRSEYRHNAGNLLHSDAVYYDYHLLSQPHFRQARKTMLCAEAAQIISVKVKKTLVRLD